MKLYRSIMSFGYLSLLCPGFFLFISTSCFSEDEIIAPVSSDVEITVEHYPSSGKYLLIWLAPEYGFRSAHRTMARLLNEQNIEVWQSNIVESLFLPQGTQSVKDLDGHYVADLIEYTHKITSKKIVVVGDSYAAITALRGAHQWQQRKINTQYLIGAILFTPYTYLSIPSLGMPPEFMPITSASNIPMMIYQAQKSATIGQFELLLEVLQTQNNPVYSRIVPNIMSFFYDEDPSLESQKNAKSLAPNLKKMIAVLERHPVPSIAPPLKKIIKNKSGIDIYLKAFKGNNQPIAINLKNSRGEHLSKNDFKGQVTLVNFWATWCPPCVEEIPSLNRLKNKMKGFPFELISINYAEEPQTIKTFLSKVNVQFPVLLDPEGDFAKQWQVITFPSTFVIDTTGTIRYGVNAAIEWDDPSVIEKLKALMSQE